MGAEFFHERFFSMMMVGLISSVLGLAVAYVYSTLLGALLFVVGAAMLARGYLKPEPESVQAQNYSSSGGSVTYNIPSSKPK